LLIATPNPTTSRKQRRESQETTLVHTTRKAQYGGGYLPARDHPAPQRRPRSRGIPRRDSSGPVGNLGATLIWNVESALDRTVTQVSRLNWSDEPAVDQSATSVSRLTRSDESAVDRPVTSVSRLTKSDESAMNRSVTSAPKLTWTSSRSWTDRRPRCRG
jgi:hypothetical protein